MIHNTTKITLVRFLGGESLALDFVTAARNLLLVLLRVRNIFVVNLM